PDTRTMIASATDALSVSQATVRLSSPDPQGCKTYLNGVRAVPQQAYVVDPTATYFARMDCGLPSSPPVWRVTVEGGKDVEVFAPPLDPSDFRAEDSASDEGRRQIEWYLQAVAIHAGA